MEKGKLKPLDPSNQPLVVNGKLQKSKSFNNKKTDLSSVKFEGALNYTDVNEYKLGKMLG